MVILLMAMVIATVTKASHLTRRHTILTRLMGMDTMEWGQATAIIPNTAIGEETLVTMVMATAEAILMAASLVPLSLRGVIAIVIAAAVVTVSPITVMAGEIRAMAIVAAVMAKVAIIAGI